MLVTPGHDSDVAQAPALLDGLGAVGAVVADKGYDADWLVAQIEATRAEAVIPPRRNRLQPRSYDTNLYADRNKVERLFSRLKQYRRVATRYEKTARNYLAFVHVASVLTLLL